jgi:hypothetical protein
MAQVKTIDVATAEKKARGVIVNPIAREYLKLQKQAQRFKALERQLKKIVEENGGEDVVTDKFTIGNRFFRTLTVPTVIPAGDQYSLKVFPQ